MADPRAFTCVLFDLDGTLVDTAPGITETVSFTLDQLGWPAEDPATLLRHCGPPLIDGFVDVSGMTREQAAAASAVYRQRYSSDGVAHSTLFPGIPELLDALSQQSIPLAVATSKVQASAKPLLTRFGIARYFSAIVGSDEAQARAAKVDVVREALRQLAGTGADVSRPVLIGDRSYDVAGAAEAGVPAIGALWGYAVDEAELAGAIGFADTPQDLLPFLESGNQGAI